jgi:hypothetical protein
MSKDKLHIDNYFKQGLKDLEVAPPPDAWKNIEEQLDKKKISGMFYIWTALAAGLALLIGIGSLLKYDNSHVLKSVNHNKTQVAVHQGKTLETQSVAGRLPEPDLNQSISSKNPEIKNSTRDQNKFVATARMEAKRILPKNTGHVSVTDKTEATPNDQYKNQSITDKTELPRNLAMDNQSKQKPYGPLGINLRGKTRQDLIIPPSYIQKDSPMTETNPLLAEAIENPVVQKVQKWSMTGQVAPLYSYRNSNQSNQSGPNNEKGLVAYSGGIKVNYRASRRLSFQTGVYYAVMGQTVDDVSVLTFSRNTQYYGQYNTYRNVLVSSYNSMGPITSNYNSASTYVFSNLPNNKQYDLTAANSVSVANSEFGTVVQKLNFIEVPFLARYKIIDRKAEKDKPFGVHLIGGFSTNFLVNNYAILKVNGSDKNIGFTADLNQVNYSGTLGFGIDYGLFRKIDLSIEPTYKYYLNSISSNKNIDFRPYAFGLFTGLVYKF